jgi:hypothetical protein
MAGMSWEHAPEARAALNAIVTDPDHGVAALSNASTMSNLLKDYLPDAPREKSILVAAAEAGLADTLREHVSQGMDPDTAIRLTASSFSSSTPFTPEACDWVTDEIAVALGISKTPTRADQQGAGQRGAGQQGAGQQGGPPPGVAAPGYSPPPTNQAPGQGPGRPNPQEQPTAPGYRPGYAPGPQPGFAQPQGAGFPGQRPPPQPYQPQPTQRYPGAQVRPYPVQQAQPYPGQPRPYPAQPGFQQPGTPAGWGPGYGPGGFGRPPKQGGRRGLLVALTIVVLIAIVVVAAVLLTRHTPTHSRGAGSPTGSPTSPASAPTGGPTANRGVEPLAVIMNPTGSSPVGTLCEQPTDLYGIKASTLSNRTFCVQTALKNVVVWGFQFDSYRHYLAGLRRWNSVTGFVKTSSGCPPPQGDAGAAIWHANKNRKYIARPGQILECFTQNQSPVLIWTMPTMNVIFVARDIGIGDSVSRIYNQWWVHLNYG